MISTRRIATILAVAAGATGLGVSAASAAAPLVQPQTVSVTGTLDDLSSSSVPAAQRAELPAPSSQLQGIGQGLDQVNQLQQLTGLAAPVTGLLPSLG